MVNEQQPDGTYIHREKIHRREGRKGRKGPPGSSGPQCVLTVASQREYLRFSV